MNKDATSHIYNNKLKTQQPETQSTRETINDEHVEQPKRSYASVAKDNIIPPQKQSRTNFHQSNVTIKERLQSLHPMKFPTKNSRETSIMDRLIPDSKTMIRN